MEAAAQTHLESQFATPLWIYTLDSKVQEDLKLDLLRLATEMRAVDPKGLVKSNRGGWRSDSELHKRDDPVIKKLRKEANEAVQSFWKAGLERTPHAKGKSGNPKFKLNGMWMNMLGVGDSNNVHKHSAALLSGVYYVNIPKTPGPSATSGALKFRDPRPQTSVYDDLEWLGMGAEVQVNPKEGMILLWPAWLEHYVEPLIPGSSEEDRRLWAEAAKRGTPGVLGPLESSPPENLRIVVAFNVAVGKS